MNHPTNGTAAADARKKGFSPTTHVKRPGTRRRFRAVLAMGAVFLATLGVGNASAEVLIYFGNGFLLGGGSCADWAEFVNANPGASCYNHAAVVNPNQAHDVVLQRVSANAVSLNIGGKKLALMSDAAQGTFDTIQKKYSLRKKADLDAMSKAVAAIKNDNGPISDQRIKQLSKEFKVSIVDAKGNPYQPKGGE